MMPRTARCSRAASAWLAARQSAAFNASAISGMSCDPAVPWTQWGGYGPPCVKKQT